MVRVELYNPQRRFSAVQLRPSAAAVAAVAPISSSSSSSVAAASGMTTGLIGLSGGDGSGAGSSLGLSTGGDSQVSCVTVSVAGISLLNTKDSPVHRSLPVVCPVTHVPLSSSSTSSVSTLSQQHHHHQGSNSCSVSTASTTATSSTASVSLSRSHTVHAGCSKRDAAPRGVVSCSQMTSESSPEIGVAGANVLSVAINGGAACADVFGGSEPHLSADSRVHILTSGSSGNISSQVVSVTATTGTSGGESSPERRRLLRTTETQTEEAARDREARRRLRRERRQQRRQNREVVVSSPSPDRNLPDVVSTGCGGNGTSNGGGGGGGGVSGCPVGASGQPPPPYSTLPLGRDRALVGVPRPPPRRWVDRHPFPVPGVRRSRSNGARPPPPPPPPTWAAGIAALGLTSVVEAAAPEPQPKGCCGSWAFSGSPHGTWPPGSTTSVSVRWFVLVIAFVGLCCTVVGTVLGALKAAGREHLTISLLMIGVGIVLMTVSAIAWRLTANDAPSWRLMLGLSRSTSSNLANGLLATTSCPTGLNLIAGPGAGQCAGAATAGGIVADDPNNAVCEPRRFLGLTRLPGSPVGAAGCAPNATGASGAGYPRIGPPMHPHHLAHVPGSPAYNAAAAAAAAMMYPEFQFRPPPPSYQASMQEYRLRLLLLDRHHSAPPAVSPPPTYRSNTSTLRPGLTLGRESDVSRPPSYRSRSSSVVPRPLPTDGAPSSSSQQTSPRHPNGAHPSAPHHSRDASLTVSLLSQELGDEDSCSDFPAAASPSAHVVPSSPLNHISAGCSNNNNNSNSNKPGAGQRDGNTVTILQTTDYSQVNGQESVVVTVPGLGRGQQTVSGASRGGPLLIPNINAISGSQILNVVARV